MGQLPNWTHSCLLGLLVLGLHALLRGSDLQKARLKNCEFKAVHGLEGDVKLR